MAGMLSDDGGDDGGDDGDDDDGWDDDVWLSVCPTARRRVIYHRSGSSTISLLSFNQMTFPEVNIYFVTNSQHANSPVIISVCLLSDDTNIF